MLDNLIRGDIIGLWWAVLTVEGHVGDFNLTKILNKVARSCATTIISCFVFKLPKLVLAFWLL